MESEERISESTAPVDATPSDTLAGPATHALAESVSEPTSISAEPTHETLEPSPIGELEMPELQSAESDAPEAVAAASSDAVAEGLATDTDTREHMRSGVLAALGELAHKFGTTVEHLVSLVGGHRAAQPADVTVAEPLGDAPVAEAIVISATEAPQAVATEVAAEAPESPSVDVPADLPEPKVAAVEATEAVVIVAEPEVAEVAGSDTFSGAQPQDITDMPELPELPAEDVTVAFAETTDAPVATEDVVVAEYDTPVVAEATGTEAEATIAAEASAPEVAVGPADVPEETIIGATAEEETTIEPATESPVEIAATAADLPTLAELAGEEDAPVAPAVAEVVVTAEPEAAAEVAETPSATADDEAIAVRAEMNPSQSEE
jgi:hypothetical protein